MDTITTPTVAEEVKSTPEVELTAVKVSQPVIAEDLPKVASVKDSPKSAIVEEPKPFIIAKPSVAVVVVETEVARLLQKLVTDSESVTWSSLPRTLTKAMELAEQVYGLTGVQKRQLVIDALTQLVRTVGKEAGTTIADPVFEAMLPSLVDHFVTVSKDGLSINVTPPTPSGCLAFLCCSK